MKQRPFRSPGAGAHALAIVTAARAIWHPLRAANFDQFARLAT
jgi:hypothetical protein